MPQIYSTTGYSVSINFSLTNPEHIICISGNRVQQWNINGNQTGPTYTASHTAFSSDHTHFALCNGSIVTVWDSNSGALGAEVNVTQSKHCCFSPDGRLVAVSCGPIAYVWNIANSVPHLVSRFTGHTDAITSLIFSSPPPSYQHLMTDQSSSGKLMLH